MKEIKINEIQGFKIGHAQNIKGGTGVTAIVAPKGAVAGVDVRGGAPATRETDLMKPENMAEVIHGVVLSGGSAYGLDAAGGVMEVLESKCIGFDVEIGVVPELPGACIFDLSVGDFNCRPTREMGAMAAKKALGDLDCHYSEGDVSVVGPLHQGNYGAGTAATVGKLKGDEYSMKSGVGTFAAQIDDLKVGAISVVNAFGDITDITTGKKIAGTLNDTKDGIIDTEQCLLEKSGGYGNFFNVDITRPSPVKNTTITCVITNGKLTKSQCTKIASIVHDGYARAIKPVHTSADGDTVFIMSSCETDADFDVIGAAATDAVSKAIANGIKYAESAYGHIASCDLKQK